MSQYPKNYVIYDDAGNKQAEITVRSAKEFETMVSGCPEGWSTELVEQSFSIDDIIKPIIKRHGSWAAAVARSAVEDALRQRPDDLCSVLRRTWDSSLKPERTIAQAIDLGLGVEKTKRIIVTLQARDLSHDKVGDDA
jgi:hypothetical protein